MNDSTSPDEAMNSTTLQSSHSYRATTMLLALMSLVQCSKQESPPSKPPPTTAEVNEILEGIKVFVDAQYTFYVFVTRKDRFAANIKELGSSDEQSGTVLHLGTWYASDAINEPDRTPIHGYSYSIIPEKIKTDIKDGFLIIAAPEDPTTKWPIYITPVHNAEGGRLQLLSSDTYVLTQADKIQATYAYKEAKGITTEELEELILSRDQPIQVISNFRINIE